MNDEVISLLKECRDLLLKISGGSMMLQPSDKPHMTFEELVAAYLEYSKSKVKESTLAAYENLLISSPFAKSLSGRDVAELTRASVQLWIDSFDEHTSYIHNFVVVFRSMVAWARDRELCAMPEEYSKPFRFKRLVRKGGGEEICDVDYDVIEKYVSDNMTKDRKYAAVYVAMRTGMRIGEICGLSPDDIDSANSVIHIRHTLKRVYSPVNKKSAVVIGDPKSKTSRRSIPVEKSVVDACLMHDMHSETLFKTEPRELLEFFTRLQKRAGCSRRYTFHSLRHTFVSREIRAGKNPKAVSKYVGHGKLDITLAVYTHVSENDLREVVNG